MKRFIAFLFCCLCALAFGNVLAVTLETAKDPGGDVNWLFVAVGLVVLALLCALGFIGYREWKAKQSAGKAAFGPIAGQVGTVVSADVTALVGKIDDLIGHMKDTAAATAAKTAPAGGDGVAGMLIVKVIGTPSVDIPAIATA